MPTEQQIQSLSDEAASAGDLATVHICHFALDGNAEALREVIRMLSDASAQDVES